MQPGEPPRGPRSRPGRSHSRSGFPRRGSQEATALELAATGQQPPRLHTGLRESRAQHRTRTRGQRGGPKTGHQHSTAGPGCTLPPAGQGSRVPEVPPRQVTPGVRAPQGRPAPAGGLALAFQTLWRQDTFTCSPARKWGAAASPAHTARSFWLPGARPVPGPRRPGCFLSIETDTTRSKHSSRPSGQRLPAAAGQLGA